MSAHAYINNTPYQIKDDETVLTFLKRVKGEKYIPTLCDIATLTPHGSCRVCSVEIAQNPEGPYKVIASCHTPVTKNLYIRPHTEKIQKLRKNIIELVLSDHPQSCLGCKSSGNCELQEVAAVTGIREIRYDTDRKTHLNQTEDKSHPIMRSELSKCINCYRCVRACDEIQGQFVLNIENRGFDSRIVKGLNQNFKESDCVSCGACVQACPTAAISDVFESKSATVTKTKQTTCSYCGVGCNLDVGLDCNNKIHSITGVKDAPVNNGHLCVKGRYAFKFVNHPERLTDPLIREGNEFIKVSWDEVYEKITDKLKSIKTKHGPDAIAGISSSRCANEENYLMQKLMRNVIGTNNIDGCARVCHAPTAYGMQQAFGTGAATNSIDDLNYTDFIFIIGANPTEAHPVTGAKIKQKMMQGTPSLVIDPRKTELAKYATYHLMINPGSNVAILNMLFYYIIQADLMDHDFITNRCENFDKLKKQVMALDMDEYAHITGISKDLAKEAAIAYASAPNAMEFHGLGVTEHSQGSKTVMMIANLVLMAGNIGRKGVGMNPLRGQNNVQGGADMGIQPHQGPGYLLMDDDATQAHYEKIYGHKLPRSAGFKIPEMFDAAKAGDLKALWIMGEDVVQTDPNTQEVVDSLDNLDLLIVQDIFMSETAKLADIVLPASSFLEKEGTFTNGERRIQRVNQVISPIANSKPDGVIISEIIQKMGYPQVGYTASNLLKEISQVVPFFKGVTWENLGTNGKQWPVLADGTDTQILHTESFKCGLGKFNFFPWKQSEEIKNHQADFPYVLITGRDLVHYNCGTMTRRSETVDIVKEDVLLINPNDAKIKHIHDGDIINISSARGSVSISAKVTDEVKPGTVFTTFHFPEIFINNITSSIQDEESLCPEYKVTAVKFEKISNAAV